MKGNGLDPTGTHLDYATDNGAVKMTVPRDKMHLRARSHPTDFGSDGIGPSRYPGPSKLQRISYSLPNRNYIVSSSTQINSTTSEQHW